MQILFVSATGTDVGKTHAVVTLIEHFAAHGIRTGACKPIETGVVGIPSDAQQLLKASQAANPTFAALSPMDLTVYTFPLPAAPFSADVDHTIRKDVLLEKIEKLSQLCELLIVEGAGGLMVPITRDFMMIDLAEALKAKVLLVTPSRLGCINETLLSVEALHSRKIDFDWCVNLYEEAETFSETTQPYYDATFPNWWTLQGEGLERFVTTYIGRQESESGIYLIDNSTENPSI
jgi:dethiobiotin synthetase